MSAIRQYPPAGIPGALQYVTEAGDFGSDPNLVYTPENYTLWVAKLRQPGGNNEFDISQGVFNANSSGRWHFSAPLHFGVNFFTPADVGIERTGPGALKVSDGATGAGRLAMDIADIGNYVHLNDWGTLYFGNDTTLQRPAAGSIRVTDGAGGLGSLYANRVGIGTTDPQRALEINALSPYQMRIGSGIGEYGVYGYDIGRDGDTGLLNFYGLQAGANGYVFGGVDGERMRITAAGRIGIGTADPQGPLDVWVSGSQRVIVSPEGHVGIGGAVFWNNGTSMLSGSNQFGNRGTISDGSCFMPQNGVFGFTDGDYTHNSAADTFLRRIAAGALGTDGTFTVGSAADHVQITQGCIFTANQFGNRWQMVDHATSRLGLTDSFATNYDGGAIELSIGTGKSAICGGSGGIGYLTFWTGDYSNPAMWLGSDGKLSLPKNGGFTTAGNIELSGSTSDINSTSNGSVVLRSFGTPVAAFRNTTATFYRDAQWENSTTGPLLTDRTTGNVYRLKIDSGTLGVELA